MSSGQLRPSMQTLFVSTHAEITIHSYKNGMSEICKNGKLFPREWRPAAYWKTVEHVDINSNSLFAINSQGSHICMVERQ